MALRTTLASSQNVVITSDVLDYNADYTICGWLYAVSTGDDRTQVMIGKPGDSRYDAIYFYSGSFLVEATAAGGYTFGSTATANTWYHVAMVRSGNDCRMYVNGVLDATVTGSPAGRVSATEVNLGYRGFYSGSYASTRFWGWKAWTRALTAAELIAESKQAMPVSSLSLYGVWPFLAGATRAKDFSGKGHDWTETNSPTDEDPPNVRFRGPEPLLFWPPAAAGGTTVTPDTASLVITTFAPTVTATANNTVTPPTAALVTSAFAPTVTVSSNNVCTPATAALTTTGYAPTVTASSHQTAIPTTAALVLTTFAPTVTSTGNQACTPTTAALVLTTFAPTVTASSTNVCTPDTAALVITTYAPSVYTANTCTPDTAALTLTAYAPTVTVSGVNPIITYGEWDTTVLLSAGEEWMVTLTGPSCDAPKARVAIRFRDASA